MQAAGEISKCEICVGQISDAALVMMTSGKSGGTAMIFPILV